MFSPQKLTKKSYTKSQIKKVSYLMIGTFVIIYAVLSYFLVFNKLLNKKSSSSGKSICHNKYCFDIQVAKTDKQRKIGLMGVKNLPIKSGMFFEFGEPGKHPFWMKNTLIPLDIIRIDKDYQIVDIQTAQPCENKKNQHEVETDNSVSYTPIGKKTSKPTGPVGRKGVFCPNYNPKDNATFVLEINAGLCENLGIKIGDKLILN